MRLLATLFATVLSAAVSAQTMQRFDLHPGTTSFSSRGDIRANSGELLQGVHDSSFRGVMDVGGIGQIARMRAMVQDQNSATLETFDFIVRSGTDATGPDASTAGILGSVTGINPPSGTANASVAWEITVTPSTPITVPTTAHWSYGVALPIGGASNWVTDGLSIHGTSSTNGLDEHRSHSRLEDQAWQIVAPATTATHPGSKRSWNMSVFVEGGVVMNLMCDGRKGYGGSFPASSASTAPLPWDARLDGGRLRSQFSSIVAVNVVRSINVPFGDGAHLYVPGPYFLWYGPQADSNGVAVVPLLPFIPSSGAGAGTFHVQGLLGNASSLSLSNCQSITP